MNEDAGMEKYIEELLNSAKIFDRMYQIIRIVDPIKKKVLNYSNQYLWETDMICYEFWMTDRVCDNCISMRAYQDNDSFIKIEYKKDLVYMITAVPINVDDRVIIVEFIKNVTNNFYISEVGNEQAMELYNIIQCLNHSAVNDALTGVFNRRYIDERLPVELTNTNTGSLPVSVVFADLDCFKQINDQYGHVAGDIVLKEFAKIIEGSIRKGKDWVARYGGDEFFICLIGTENDKARVVAERIRKKLENTVFEFDHIPVKVTASFGIYSVCENDSESVSVSQLIHNVDQRLYQAKKSGSNQVV